MSSLLIKNALICDGLGRAPVPGDLLASEGKIIETAPSIPERALRSCGEGEVVDAGGAVLAPGFIDIHGHSDLEVLRHPDMPAKTGQGITTEVSGNCGAGVFPFKGNREQHRQGVKDILGTLPDNASWEWEELAGYRKAVEARRPASSLIPLQAHGALRYSCMENPGRPAADAELDRMEKELEISLEQGAAGFSTGLYYAPCCFARREELLRLCRAVARRGKLFSVHHRNEGAQAVESLEEILQVALEAGVKTQISHLKVIGKTQQHRVPAMLGLLEENRDRGLDVAFDQYPYLYGSTSLFSLLPPDLLGMAKKDMQAALAESANWREIERQIMEPDGWDSLVPLCGWEKIFITSVSEKRYRGMSLAEAAEKENDSPARILFRLLSKETGTATMIDYTQSEESLLRIMSHPLQMFGTDALFSGARPHPRSFNTVFHLFDLYYRQKKTDSLENLVRRWTSRPAERIGLTDRGRLAPGYRADLLLFRPDRMKDLSSIGEPDRPGEGIVRVFRAEDQV